MENSHQVLQNNRCCSQTPTSQTLETTLMNPLAFKPLDPTENERERQIQPITLQYARSTTNIEKAVKK